MTDIEIPVVIDWDDVPFDYENEEDIPEEWRDQDNSILAVTGGVGIAAFPDDPQEHAKKLAALKPPPPKVLVVPYRGETKPGARGFHVVAYKRAISRAEPNVYKWRKVFTPLYGPTFKIAVQKFQKAKRLTPDGVIGPLTHKAIARYFLPYEQRLYSRAKVEKDPNAVARGRVLSYTAFLYNNRVLIHYTQSTLRMYGLRNHIIPPSVTRYEDCSSMFKYVSWLSGLPCPDHLGYSQPSGFTGTMIEAGHAVPKADSDIGDAFFYGRRWVPSHVAMCIKKGGGKVFSHGSEIGPLIVPSYYRSDLNPYHPVVRYLAK